MASFHPHHPTDMPAPDARAHNARLMKLASVLSLGVAGLLIVIKLVAWAKTDSLSLLSSLVDSLLDVASSLVIFVAVRYSLQPPDAEHRFGHGKAEDVASFAQAAFITGSALFIGFEAIGRFLNPRPIEHSMIGIAVMGISILLTLALVLFQHYVIRRTNSTAIHSDSLHYVGDVLVNSAVIASLVVENTLGWQLADPITALFISAYILYNAWQIAAKAFQHLMDREFSDEDREQIIQTVLKNPGAKGMHALRTRRSGITPFIQFHLEMDGETTLFDAHTIVEDIHSELIKIFPGAEVIIHEDPTEIDEDHRDEDRRVAEQ